MSNTVKILVFYLVIIHIDILAKPTDYESLVDNVITAFNRFIKLRNSGLYSLDDHNLNLLVIDVSLINGQIGDFSSFGRSGQSNIQMFTDSIDYTVGVTINELVVSYDYKGSYFWFKDKGKLTVSVPKNTFLLAGLVSYPNNKYSCKAILNHALLTEFGEITVDIQPTGILHYLIGKVYYYILNQLRSYYITSVHAMLRNDIKIEDFSAIVCNVTTIDTR